MNKRDLPFHDDGRSQGVKKRAQKGGGATKEGKPRTIQRTAHSMEGPGRKGDKDLRPKKPCGIEKMPSGVPQLITGGGRGVNKGGEKVG